MVELMKEALWGQFADERGALDFGRSRGRSGKRGRVPAFFQHVPLASIDPALSCVCTMSLDGHGTPEVQSTGFTYLLTHC